MSENGTTIADLKSAVDAIYSATNIDSLRKRFIEFGEIVDSYEGSEDIEEIINHRKVPEFTTPNAPPYPGHISTQWWSRDDERILVGLAFNEFDMYFVNYDGERI